MSATQLVAEFLIIGGLSLLGAATVFNVPILSLGPLSGSDPLVAGTFLGAIAYVTGFFVNVIAEFVFRPLYRAVEARWTAREGNPSLVLDHLRYDVYISAPSGVINRLEYHRSLLRLSRCISLVAVILLIAALIARQFIVAGILFAVLLLGMISYQRRVMWFTKSVYFSWLAQNRKENIQATSDDSVAQVEPQLHRSERKETHVVVFAGGTGFREINIELTRHTRHISRIVPIWDNGGSSKILRQHFPVIPIGDVRHALMTMAHGEGGVDQVVRLFNWRLPDAGSEDELRRELNLFTCGQHPLMVSIEPSLKDVIVTYLELFQNALPASIDLKHGSIGNFVLMGAYLAHAKNMNTAIYVFRQICSIYGDVWPVSLQTDLHIGVHLEDGQNIVGQELVTNLDRNRYRGKIESVFFTQGVTQRQLPQPQLQVRANPLVLEALKTAGVVVYGPGSFFTSILPHLMVDGVVDAIASLDVPKVLVGNMLESNETYNWTLEELVDLFLQTADEYASARRAAHKYVTHILVNDSSRLGFLPSAGRRYLPPGKDLEHFTRDGISLISHDFADPWRRGYHDPRRVAELITALCMNRLNPASSPTPSQT
jgi:CofD-related protein of GAK system